jgi:glutathione S-transferase
VKLYYSPLACSLADHIALEESGVSCDFERVDLHAKVTASGRDFTAITRKGYVPVLVLDDGQVLTENIAILDWIASRHPQLSVGGPLGRTRVLEAMTYISTEIHRAFKPMWHRGDEAEQAQARDTIASLLQLFDDTMAGDYIFGDHPSVADFYLFVMLLWAVHFGVPTPAKLDALRDRIAARPAVQAVMRAEGLT